MGRGVLQEIDWARAVEVDGLSLGLPEAAVRRRLGSPASTASGPDGPYRVYPGATTVGFIRGVVTEVRGARLSQDGACFVAAGWPIHAAGAVRQPDSGRRLDQWITILYRDDRITRIVLGKREPPVQMMPGGGFFF